VNLKRIAWLAFVILLVLYVVKNPAHAQAQAQGLVAFGQQAAAAFSTFVAGL
jgi:hypothetical protein